MTAMVSFKAEKRNSAGKGFARSLRREKRIPAIIYGKGQENLHVSLDELEVKKYCYKVNFCSVLVDIEVDGKKYKTLPKKVQLHPVNDSAEHIDFIYVAADTEIKVTVHLHFLNEDKCIGIKRGGVINFVKRDIELWCHPDAIPHHIDVDVVNLNIGDSIHINDLNLPAGTKIVKTNKDFTIATLVGRAKDEEKNAESDTAAKSSK
jgi:large subunit ribosomal protein L25